MVCTLWLIACIVDIRWCSLESWPFPSQTFLSFWTSATITHEGTLRLPRPLNQHFKESRFAQRPFETRWKGKKKKKVSFRKPYWLDSTQPPSLCRKEQAENEADLMEFRRWSQNVLQWEVKDRQKGRRDPRGSGSGPGHQKETLTSNWTAAAAQHILQSFEWLLKVSIGKSRLPSLFGVIAGLLVTVVNLSWAIRLCT